MVLDIMAGMLDSFEIGEAVVTGIVTCLQC